MNHEEETFSAASGASIYSQSWLPGGAAETPPRAMIVLAHGLGEHSGRYVRFADFATARGYGVAALDHAGHGRSEGTPGFIDRFSEYVESLDRFRSIISDRWNGVPQILLGHSMGGLISALYLLENQHAFSGCVLSGPAIQSDIEPGAFQMGLIRFLSTLFPKIGVLGLDAAGVSRDPVEVKRYLDDPLVYNGKMSARLVSELFESMQRVQNNAAKISIPLLLLHGGADSMASPKGSQLLAERASSESKRLEIYPGLYHEIFNEPEHEQIFDDLLTWCDELIANGTEVDSSVSSE